MASTQGLEQRTEDMYFSSLANADSLCRNKLCDRPNCTYLLVQVGQIAQGKLYEATAPNRVDQNV